MRAFLLLSHDFPICCVTRFWAGQPWGVRCAGWVIAQCLCYYKSFYNFCKGPKYFIHNISTRAQKVCSKCATFTHFKFCTVQALYILGPALVLGTFGLNLGSYKSSDTLQSAPINHPYSIFIHTMHERNNQIWVLSIWQYHQNQMK